MKFFITILLAFFSVNSVFSQSILIKGKVTNANKTPIDLATVYLNRVKDSSLVNYTITEPDGSFTLSVQKQNASSILIISADGYNDYVNSYESITSDIAVNNIILQKSSNNNLQEIVITTNVAPVKIKTDTLEFNASSFKVREDATVKSLLEQLPGVVVGDDGKIRINGKEVNNILVNGKPFFDESGKVILSNLPANMIDKVQVTDYKTNEQKQANETATTDQKTINLTIKDEKNKGFFGNVTGGYGSDERYESSLLINYFNKDRKLSVLASSNNINSLGFTNNDIFDNMASSRSNSFTYSDDGTIGINGVNLGGGKGIYSTNMLGINYNETFNKKHYLGANYIFNQIDFENQTYSRTENLLPNQKLITESSSNQNQITTSHNAAVQAEIKLRDDLTLNIAPKVTASDVDYAATGISETRNETANLLNTSDYTNQSNTKQKVIQNNMSLVKRFKKKNRSLITFLDLSFNENNRNTINDSENNFIETNTQDIRNQNIISENATNQVSLGSRFKEPVGYNKELTVGFTYKNDKNSWDQNTFNFNSLTNNYNQADDLLTFQNSFQVNEFTPVFSLKHNFKKGYININTQSKITDYTLKSSFLNNNYHKNNVDVLPMVSLSANIPTGKQANIYVRYSYEEALNNLRHLAPIQDFSNPLNTVIGNPDLKNTQEHSLQVNYYTYNPETKSGNYFYLGSTINTRNVINNYTYDQNFKGTLTYQSANAGSNSYFGYGTYKNFKINETHTLGYDGSISASYDVGYGITNTQKFSSYNLSLTPQINAKWKIKDILDLSAGYALTNNYVDYKNYTIDNAKFSQHKVQLISTVYWPKNIVFGNDLTYNYNTNISDGFKKDFFLWNTSLGYKFYNDRFTAKVKVYDLLNQNQNVRRTATATQIADTYNTILKRYVMFSLTYKLSKFGEKPKSRFRHDED